MSKELERIKEQALLIGEEIETIVRKVFPLFDLNEEGEEDRKEATLNLLKAQLDKLLKTDGIRIEADSQDLASAISINLGYLAVEIGELFDNYPENFNKTIPKLGEKLKEAGFVRCLSKEEK